MEEISGYLSSILFSNKENNYNVVKIKLDDGSDEKLVVVGYFPLPRKDELMIYKGEFIEHQRYGKQFQVSSIEKVLPTSKDSIIRYLSSSSFLGIGKEKATKIVAALGDNCLDLIKENPAVLDNLVSLKDKNIIVNGLKDNSLIEKAIIILTQAGISLRNIMKMEAVYKEKMLDIVLDNPYVLIDDIEGIGFLSADKIAHNLNISENDLRRIKAAIVYSLNLLCMESGDTFSNLEAIARRVNKIVTNISKEEFLKAFNALLAEGKIVTEDEKIFPFNLNYSEKRIASFLTPFINRKMNVKVDLDEYLKIIEDELGIVYSPVQKEAIKSALNNGISIISGGPGTGKTTILNAIIKIYKRLYPDNIITLVAPTGKASKRMSEITNEVATTIHRLLKWDLHSNYFAKNEADPLIGDILIIDEFSMVDSYLFSKLLEASYQYNQIVIIGDADQLPSVAPGNVLLDLMDSKLIKVSILNKIFRQENNSSIITLAHHIKDKKLVLEDLKDSLDFKFIDSNAYYLKDHLIEQVNEALNLGYSLDEIAILAPIYSGSGGIDHLNEIIQAKFNPPDGIKKELRTIKFTFRENDKILQLKNQPDDDVYNGDVGRLVEISEKDALNKTNKLVVAYDDNLVVYTPQDFINIKLAYVISVHKSQGSEYPYLIMPIINQYGSMLTKNLIYTGISRAKKKLVIIGDKNLLIEAVKKRELKRRKTTLIEKLKCLMA